jgi:hypothetical protein
MGINVGWGDIYTWDLPDQYLDITDVQPGVYDLISMANPDCKIEELSHATDASATRIQIAADGSVAELSRSAAFAPPCASS